jgi:thiamine-phosphate pyrophosphorylase
MITDRRAAGGTEALVGLIEKRLAEGIDFVQIREKDLEARELFELTREVVEAAAPYTTRVVVNSRMDVALAARAHGVHLPANSPQSSEWRQIARDGFLIGMSCHTADEVMQAQNEGADYALFGPVFPPLSKADTRAPHGAEGLRMACQSSLPVFALGGVTEANATACIEAGAAGVAGISLFL